jgi:hypothetical protein
MTNPAALLAFIAAHADNDVVALDATTITIRGWYTRREDDGSVTAFQQDDVVPLSWSAVRGHLGY